MPTKKDRHHFVTWAGTCSDMVNSWIKHYGTLPTPEQHANWTQCCKQMLNDNGIEAEFSLFIKRSEHQALVTVTPYNKMKWGHQRRTYFHLPPDTRFPEPTQPPIA